jgi:hypothetical protein
MRLQFRDDYVDVVGGKLQSSDGTLLFSPHPGGDFTQERVPPYSRPPWRPRRALGQRFPQLAQFPQGNRACFRMLRSFRAAAIELHQRPRLRRFRKGG